MNELTNKFFDDIFTGKVIVNDDIIYKINELFGDLKIGDGYFSEVIKINKKSQYEIQLKRIDDTYVIIPINVVFKKLKKKNLSPLLQTDISYINKHKKISYYCKSDSIYCEFFILKRVSLLFEEGITPHVVLCVGAFSSNIDARNVIDSILMEEIHSNKFELKLPIVKSTDNVFKKTISTRIVTSTSLKTFLNYIYMNEKDKLCMYMEVVFFTVLHTLYYIKKHIGRIENIDLHCGNIFVKFIDSSKYFRGENLSTIKTFTYKVNDSYYEIVNPTVIFKIGDFGISHLETENVNFSSSIIEMSEFIALYQYNQINSYTISHYIFLYELLILFPNSSKLLSEISTDLEINYYNIQYCGFTNTLNPEDIIIKYFKQFFIKTPSKGSLII